MQNWYANAIFLQIPKLSNMFFEIIFYDIFNTDMKPCKIEK